MVPIELSIQKILIKLRNILFIQFIITNCIFIDKMWKTL